MTKVIGGLDVMPTSVGNGTGAAPTGTAGAAASPQPTAEAGDSREVQITSAASRLAELERGLSARPVIDAERVARVSAAIANGTYGIDAKRIAGGLIASEQTLAALP